MTEVYILQKWTSYEEHTIIGAFSSKEKIIEAIKRDLKIELDEYQSLDSNDDRFKRHIKNIEFILTEDGKIFISKINKHNNDPENFYHYIMKHSYSTPYKELSRYSLFLRNMDYSLMIELPKEFKP